MEVELETEVDSAKVKNFVDTQCQGITAEPQNASITRENGQFVITDSVPGRVVDVAGTEAALNEALEGGLDQPIEVTAQVTEEQPAITSEALATIQDVLGTYTTDFSSSGAARSTNLAVGAAKINGHVLSPGMSCQAMNACSLLPQPMGIRQRRPMRTARSWTASAEACASWLPLCIMLPWKRKWRLSRDRTTP